MSKHCHTFLLILGAWWYWYVSFYMIWITSDDGFRYFFSCWWWWIVLVCLCTLMFVTLTLIARFIGPTWGPSGADRTHVDPILASWTLLSRYTLVLIKAYDRLMHRAAKQLSKIEGKTILWCRQRFSNHDRAIMDKKCVPLITYQPRRVLPRDITCHIEKYTVYFACCDEEHESDHIQK